MPEGFLRSLQRRSVRARQSLFGPARRRHKRPSDSFLHENTDSAVPEPAPNSIVRSPASRTDATDVPPAPPPTPNGNPPPDILNISAISLHESPRRRPVVHPEGEIKLASLKHSLEFIFKTPSKRAAARQEEGASSPPSQVATPVKTPSKTSVSKVASPSGTPLSRSKSVRGSKTGEKEKEKAVDTLTTSFLRRSIRRRSVLHFATPRPRPQPASEAPTPNAGEDATGEALQGAPWLPPALLTGVLVRLKRSAGSALGCRDARTRKFAALHDDACLRYYPTKQDYTAGARGKEVWLRCAAVRVPRPQTASVRSRSRVSLAAPPPAAAATPAYATPKRHGSWYGRDGVELTGFQARRSGGTASPGSIRSVKAKELQQQEIGAGCNINEDEDLTSSIVLQFEVVSCDGRAWRFEAPSRSERDAWVAAIERQILLALQKQTRRPPLHPSKFDNSVLSLKDAVSAHNTISHLETTSSIDALSLRCIPGNEVCADCGAPEPTWASVGVGVLTCIACSGAHRSLGSHISRVRSLELDHWTSVQVDALRLVGNQLANRIWEADTGGLSRPDPDSSVDVKRRWVQAKYEARAFLPQPSETSGTQSAPPEEVVRKRDVEAVIAAAASGDTTSLASMLRTALQDKDEALAQMLVWGGAPAQPEGEEEKLVVDLLKTYTSVSTLI